MGICTVDNTLSTCEIQDDQIVCPKISMCLAKLQSEFLPVNIVNVLAGMYYDDDCDNIVSTAPSGTIIINSSGGTAIFYCLNTQFLSITFSETTTLVIDDFVIIGGSDPQNNSKIEVSDISYGQSNVYIENLFVTNCSSANNGGFMSAININMIKTINSKFSYNGAKNSSSVFYAPYSVLEMTDSSFDNNYAYGYGGVGEGLFLNINNSTFLNNGAFYAGGCFIIYNDIYTELSKFTLSWAIKGGALYSQYGETKVQSSQFSQNGAISGGAFYGRNITVTSSYFEENICSKQWSGYGGVAFAVPVLESGEVTVIFKDSIFKKNNAFYGGGVGFFESADLFVDNCDFTSNGAEQSGGVFYLANYRKSQMVQITNSIFSQNAVNQSGGCIYLQNDKSNSGLNLTGSIFENNSAERVAGAILFSELPIPFIGGEFLNSNSSESNSTTFYSKSLDNVNLVNITKNLPEYTVPIFKESDFLYWKVIGAQGTCNGVATIDEQGDILSCNPI